MSEKTNVPMKFGVSLCMLIVLTVAGVWLGRVLTTEKMESAFAVALGVLAVFTVTAYLAAYSPLEKLAEAEEELEEMASTDMLTGLLNRDRVMRRVAGEIKRAERTGKPVSIAFVEIDNFRQINSRIGPGGGDGVLRSVGSLIAESCRQYDSAGRVGSGQFLMVLPETELEDAARATERLRQRIEESQFACYGEPLAVNVSIGVSQVDVDTGETSDNVIRRAADALDRARSEGGNRVRANASLVAAEEASDSE